MRRTVHAVRLLSGLLLIAALGCAGTLPGDESPVASEVVVYTALDREFSEPIFNRFTQETGIHVLPKFDIEATKTVGLAQAILAERHRPRCDVFWNNEIVNTLRLKQAGLLEPYPTPAAATYPSAFKSTDATWYGFAARARVLLVNTQLVSPDEAPSSIFDLTAPKWRGRVGIAKPLFGTTATHAACLFVALGEERAKQFFRDLKANDVQVLAGNKQVALSVAAGDLAIGLTDTDDAIIEVRKGMPVRIVYLDTAAEQLGTLFIPNTLSMIKGCPHPEAARQMIDYLLNPTVEKVLAEGPSAQIPLNPHVEAAVQVQTPRDVKAMVVDFEQAAQRWDEVRQFISQEFTAP